MERINLAAQLREGKGKQEAKRLRRAGVIPAILYKEGKDSISLKLTEREFLRTITTKAGLNVILNLKIADGKKKDAKSSTKTVIIKDMQRHPVKGAILHVDFDEISLTEKLQVQVKVESKGEAAGVKEDGTLEHITWEVKVECLPTQIPEKFVVDVTNLKIGDSTFVKDIIPPEGVKILDDPELITFSVKPPHIEKPAEEVEEEGAPEEPELIRKEKKEEEVTEEEAPPEQKEPPKEQPK